MRRIHFPAAILGFACCLICFSAGAVTQAAEKPHLFQAPALSRELIAFGYAGDLWTVPREGGRAVRLTNGVGLESSPIFSPDGTTIAFTGEYDGNTDVFTVPAAGGIPHRVTYHPAADAAVGWTPDGKRILFRSSRESASRYTQIFSVAPEGGIPTRLPLPMAYQGQMSPDGAHIAYSPLPPAFGYDYTAFVSWGNYRGGRASTIWITGLAGLDSIEIPHDRASDFFPVFCGSQIFFLSGRAGHVGIFRYDPGTKAVAEVLHNDGPDIRSLAGDGSTLVYDQLGEIHLLDTATGNSRRVPIEIQADLPDVRPSIKNVSAEIDHAAISPTGVRAALEAHGEILTVPVKPGPTRNITNTPGVMERSPAWSPDGQSIAYFSDESGLYALHVAAQTGAAQSGAAAVRKFPLAREPAFYFAPKWSPDSKRIAFHDNRLKTYLLDTVSGKLTIIDDKNAYGGFSDASYDLAWSPDSRWIAYPRSLENHLHALFLYSIDSGKSTQLTGMLGDARLPAFDRAGKYLYYTASTNSGATSDGLDMTSDLYEVRSNIYAIVLSADQASPVAPEMDDEKVPAAKQNKAKEGKTKEGKANEGKANEGEESAGTEEGGENRGGAGKSSAGEAAPEAPAAAPAGSAAAAAKPIKVDLNGIETRAVALPLPSAAYLALAAGTHGSLYFLVRSEPGRPDDRVATLSRWTLEDRKTEKLAERIEHFELSADGEKMLLAISNRKPDAPPDPAGEDARPTWVIVPANAPVKSGDGTLALAALQVRVDPAAEWMQMYHEVWRIERSYFYDPNFHGAPTVADERRYEPYVASMASPERTSTIYFRKCWASFQSVICGAAEAQFPGRTEFPADCSEPTTPSAEIATAWPRFIRAVNSIRTRTLRSRSPGSTSVRAIAFSPSTDRNCRVPRISSSRSKRRPNTPSLCGSRLPMAAKYAMSPSCPLPLRRVFGTPIGSTPTGARWSRCRAGNLPMYTCRTPAAKGLPISIAITSRRPRGKA